MSHNELVQIPDHIKDQLEHIEKDISKQYYFFKYIFEKLEEILRNEKDIKKAVSISVNLAIKEIYKIENNCN